MLRAIREINPVWIVGENVFGIVNWDGGVVFEHIQADLEAEGYEVQPYVLPACGVNAPHRRDRVWFIAHAGLFRQEKRQFEPVGFEQLREERTVANSDSKRHEECKPSSKPSKTEGVNSEEDFGMPSDWDNFPTQPAIRGRNDGLSTELDGITVSKHRNESIKAYGNAVVPELVFQIFKSIQGYEKHKR
jgi:DNA (cytosine-5)-methyltransferase 1